MDIQGKNLCAKLTALNRMVFLLILFFNPLIVIMADAYVPCQLMNQDKMDVSEPMFKYCWMNGGIEEITQAEPAESPTFSDEKIVINDALKLHSSDSKSEKNEFLFGSTLELISGKAFATQSDFVDAIKKLNRDGWVKLTQQNQKDIIQAAKIPIAINKINLSAEGCDCSRDLSSLVYGFYPYWQADATAQGVDFSLFDRISFYALSVDKEGYIRDTLQWNKTSDAANFIRILHKYRVAADITINANHWQHWTASVIDNAVESIVDIVAEKFLPEKNRWVGLVPFWNGPSPVSVDGVTLYFDDYSKIEQGENITAVVKNIRRKLNDKGLDVKLNIILGMDFNHNDPRQSEALIQQLKNILLDEKNNKPLLDYIFIFLQSPTTDTKKTLREIIEKSFHGANRKTVLEKIVPIIHTNLSNEAENLQFIDDLIYFQYNFSGVAFWPLPLNSDKSMNLVRKNIIDLYQITQGSNRLGKFIDNYFPDLCAFVCPNRWWFRIVFNSLVGLLLLIGLTAIWNCRIRVALKNQVPIFVIAVLITITVFLLSLICDPFWKDRVDGVILSIFLLILAAIIWRYVSKAMRPPLP